MDDKKTIEKLKVSLRDCIQANNMSSFAEARCATNKARILLEEIDEQERSSKGYPCHKLPKEQWCDHHGPGGFMGHTCIPKPSCIQKPSVKAHRKRITKKQIRRALIETHTKLWSCLEQKGYGTWLSRHEILGFLTEEAFREVTKAVHEGTLINIKHELLDVAVGCIFGVACIEAGTLDW